MSKLSLDKFLALAERSELIAPERFSQVIADWKSQATLSQLDDAQYCADHLIGLGLLTDWQARKLLEGRYRGFFLGKYKLLEHLGSGGMSSVYLAEHVLMQRLVAIKVLPQNRVNDSSYLDRFHLEAQAAAALDHRNIVRVYDLDNDGKIHYLVMEYLEGRDLHARVCQDGPLDYHTAAHCIAQAAAGLEHAHRRGLVHRDVKPANLFADLEGTVKILDMGLAKFTAETRPAPGFSQDEHVLGTADYLAPEQAVNSRTVDHRADIYALGCTLYFLLTGHPPFAEGSPIERMTAHQQQIAPSVLVDRPDAPEALVAICRRMMEKSPVNRFRTAAEVETALSAWLETEAALGNVSTEALLSVGRKVAAAAGLRHQAGSKVNLVTGSTSDVHRLPAESPQLSSPFGDTDANLQRATVPMPTPRWAVESDSSHVLRHANDAPSSSVKLRDSQSCPSSTTPEAPPIVAPPRVAENATRDVPAPPISLPAAASSDACWPSSAQPFEPPTLPAVGRRKRLAATSNWFWFSLLTGVVVISVLAALAVLSH